MRKSIYKRKKKTEEKPTEAVKKGSSRGNYKGGKPKSTISEALKKADDYLKSGKKVTSKNKRGEGANRLANKRKSEQQELQATMKKTSRGSRPTEATRKLRAKIKAEKDAAKKNQPPKKTNRVPSSKAPTKKAVGGKAPVKGKTSTSEAAKAAVGKKKATEAVAEVVKKQKEKRLSPSQKVYTDKEGKKYKKVRTTASKVRGGGMKYRRKYM